MIGENLTSSVRSLTAFIMKHCLTLGRIFFAFGLIGSGLQQLVRHEFVRLVPKLPQWVASPGIWAGLSGALLIVVGLAILVDRKRRPAALAAAGLFVVVFLLYVPGVIVNPGAGYVWTNPCKTLALLGCSILLATVATDRRVDGVVAGRSSPDLTWLYGGIALGGFLIVCGVQHFVYVDFVVQLVPAWIPGLRFWAYFTGVALLAGGVGLNFRPSAPMAAALTGLMIFLWVILLHVPRALASPQDPGETSAIFEALALSGTALVVAGLTATRRTANPSR